MGLLLLLMSILPSVTVLTDDDLRPIDLGPKGELARELLQRGRFGEAADAITARTPEARFLRGTLLQRANRHAEAIGMLEGVPEALPLLAGHARRTRAEALVALERYGEAAAEAALVPLSDPDGAAARRVRARALREQGDLDAAAESYEAMIAGGRGEDLPNGLLGLARVEEARGRPKDALTLLRRLDLEQPAHWAASAARKEAAVLVKANRKLRGQWEDRSLTERIERAEKLADRHRNKEVVAALEPLGKDRKIRKKLKGDLLCRQRYTLGRALRKLRRWEPARPVIADAVRACEKVKSDLAPWARHLAGQADERLSFEEEAATDYREQMKRHPEHRLADDAGYFLVRHLIDDKEDLKAAAKQATDLVRRFPDGDMVPEALFVVAMAAFRADDRAVARAMLALDRTLPPRDTIHHDGGRTAYWLARLDALDGEQVEALAGYRSLLATHPLSWYALLAYSRLHEADPADADRAATEALTGHGPGPSLPGGAGETWKMALPPGIGGAAWQRALLYARLGLAPEARAALREAGARDDRPDILWLAAWVLDRAGAHLYSHDILRRRLFEYRYFAPDGAGRKYWTLAFPNPFAHLVAEAGAEEEVDPSFLWAVMREESGFNTGIESFANAVGLMQLIVPTAKQMGRDGDGAVNRATLADPDLNVRLGARYVAHVQAHSDGVLPLVPAGYNAGHGALKRWINERGDLPLDLFVELIPFEEARGYTKRVTSSWATYRYLYARAKGDPPMPYVSQDTRLSVVLAKQKAVAEAAAEAKAADGPL